MRVVLIGNAFNEKSMLVMELVARGFDAVGVTSSSNVYLELLHRPTDAVVLDLDWSHDECMAVSRHLRAFDSTRELGILMLGSLVESCRRIEALGNGADVYLSKPVQTDELVAYLKNIERRKRPLDIRTDPLCWRFMQSEWRLIAPSGAPIELSHLETSFMCIVARNAGKPVRRRDIIASAFGKDPLAYDNRRLEAVVSRLRRKVHRVYPFSQPIKVVHSIGYVFTDAILCN
jgi:DNA-binding response OmpR family regulator